MVLADVDITRSIQNGLDEVIAFVPELLAALLIVAVGYVVARIVGGLVTRALQGIGFDGFVHRGPTGAWVRRVTARPAAVIGTIAFWALFLGAISWGVDVLGVEALSGFVAAVWGYLPNVLAAVLIFLVAGAIAAGVSSFAKRTLGDTGLGKIVGTVAPILVMTIATFMILDQLQIAETIVTITYAALLGAIALGSALAFGLGGRDVAREVLQGAYAKGQENAEEFRRDLDAGMTREPDERKRTEPLVEAQRPTPAGARGDRPRG